MSMCTKHLHKLESQYDTAFGYYGTISAGKDAGKDAGTGTGAVW